MNKSEIEQRQEALKKSDGFCPICHKPLTTMQGAHRIANKEMWRKKYGSWVIDHPANLIIVDCLTCNNSCDVGSSYGNHLDVIADVLISEYIKMWGIEGLKTLTDKLLEKYKQMGVKNDRTGTKST